MVLLRWVPRLGRGARPYGRVRAHAHPSAAAPSSSASCLWFTEPGLSAAGTGDAWGPPVLASSAHMCVPYSTDMHAVTCWAARAGKQGKVQIQSTPLRQATGGTT